MAYKGSFCHVVLFFVIGANELLLMLFCENVLVIGTEDRGLGLRKDQRVVGFGQSRGSVGTVMFLYCSQETLLQAGTVPLPFLTKILTHFIFGWLGPNQVKAEIGKNPLGEVILSYKNISTALKPSANKIFLSPVSCQSPKKTKICSTQNFILS